MRELVNTIVVAFEKSVNWKDVIMKISIKQPVIILKAKVFLRFGVIANKSYLKKAFEQKRGRVIINCV